MTQLNSNWNSKKWNFDTNTYIKISHINADFKWSFIKLILIHQKLRTWENLPYFRKKGETFPKSQRILTKITPSDSAYQKTLLLNFQAPICKNVEFRIFCQKTDHGFVFICFFLFFFSQGSSYRPSGPRMSQEGSF